MVVCNGYGSLFVSLGKDSERESEHDANGHGHAQKARAEIERGQADTHEFPVTPLMIGSLSPDAVIS